MPLYKIQDKLIFFVHIPKTGGTSVERALSSLGKVSIDKKIEGFPTPSQHFHAEIYNKLIPSDFYDLGFAIVRNPYTRLISEYRHKFSRDKNKKLNFDAWIKKSFSDYKNNSYIHHNHIRPQIEFLLPTLTVFKFEDGMQMCVNEITKYCGIKDQVTLTREKLFKKTPLNAKRKTFELAAKFYANDFANLAYDPENFDFIEEQNIVLS